MPRLSSPRICIKHVLLVEERFTFQRLVAEDVVTTIELFSETFTRDLIYGHICETVLLSEALLTRGLLKVIPDFVPRLLVLLSKVSLVEALLVLDLHVDRVVHQAFILYRDRQLLDLVLSVGLGVLVALSQELVLLVLVVVVAVYWVEIVCFPVSLR